VYADNLKVLGTVLGAFMDGKLKSQGYDNDNNLRLKREEILKLLKTHGLAYSSGGVTHAAGVSSATKTLGEILISKDFTDIVREFSRAPRNINLDPPASLTAACTIIESLRKIYIEENDLPLPKDLSIKPLWNTVSGHLGFDPSKLGDNDLKKILICLISITDGIGALRTHAGSAHGRSTLKNQIQPRHARLAVHASHTVTVFLLESWEKKYIPKTACCSVCRNPIGAGLLDGAEGSTRAYS
jgi:hypothetical protein